MESSDEEVRGLTFSMIVCVGISEMTHRSRVYFFVDSTIVDVIFDFAAR